MFGFNIGTTRCKIATLDRSGNPTIITNARGEQTTPSVVYRDPATGEILVGTDAREQGIIDPAHVTSNFKLKLGTTESLFKNGEPFDPTSATEALICFLKKDAEASTGVEVREVVATCPANWRDNQKEALLEAFERNDIKVLRLVTEPAAAGYAYALDKGSTKCVYAVYDLGGGTFDASVIERNGSQLNVLATQGVHCLGGNDFSKCIEDPVLDEVERNCRNRPTRDADALFFLELSQKVEAAKVSLGKQKEVPIVVAYDGQQVIAKIAQEDYHAAIAPLVQQSQEALDQAIRDAGLTIHKIERLVLVGGSSLSPYVQERVADHTGLVPKTDIDPEKAIAYGAALASVAELARQGRTATVKGQVIPSPELFARDVTAHDVGCCVVENGLLHGRMVNAVIIPKNTPVPCQRSDRFYLEHEGQTKALVEVLQGKAGALREKCLLIGELVLDDLPSEDKKTERIVVEYMIDANGMVTVTATDKVSGKQQTVAVDYKKGITPKAKPAKVA